jgi:hypothetical protein
MKAVLLVVLSVVAMSQAALASDIKFHCEWQKDGMEASFYRTAGFDFRLNNKKFVVSNDTFFSRTYTPCWTGGFSQCAFGFDLPRPIDASFKNGGFNALSLEFVSVDGYGMGGLDIDFATNILTLQKGHSTEALMNGYDGDGVSIRDHKFICTKI